MVAPQVALIAAAAVGGLALVAVGAWAPLVTLLSVRMFGDAGTAVGTSRPSPWARSPWPSSLWRWWRRCRGEAGRSCSPIYCFLALSVGWAAVGYGDASGFAREWLRLASVAALAILAISAAQRAGSIERLLRIALSTAAIPAFVALGQFGTGHLCRGQTSVRHLLAPERCRGGLRIRAPDLARPGSAHAAPARLGPRPPLLRRGLHDPQPRLARGDDDRRPRAHALPAARRQARPPRRRDHRRPPRSSRSRRSAPSG